LATLTGLKAEVRRGISAKAVDIVRSRAPGFLRATLAIIGLAMLRR
jgi:hypothetical protein